jgi:uncharacterized GH25 family protein
MSRTPRQTSRRWRSLGVGIGLLLAVVTVATAHDMFLKPTRYFAPENAEVRLRLLNGTFTKSENSIARNRLADVSVITPTRRVQLDTTEWSVAGDTSTFHIHTRGSGTYVVGVSTRPNIIALSGDDFTLSLKEDGIPDALEARQRAGELGKAVKERYHKHVKSLVQVGNDRSDHYATAMGYPAEIIPMANPYSLAAGATLQVKTLVDGKPVANQLVIYGGLTPDDAGIAPKSVRSSAAGVATVELSGPGTWYIKFINMSKVQGDTVDYESKWASLTFQVR